MKRSILAIVIGCVCALAALGIVGCACSTEVSRSSDKEMINQVEQDVTAEITTDPAYILVIGNDSRYQTVEDKGVSADVPSFSDTIMLLRVDPEANSVSILTIPRDTAAELNGEPTKINAVHEAGGPDALVDYVEAMLDVDISYYFDLKFVDFVNFVNKLGSVGLDVPMSISGTDIVSGEDRYVEAGWNDLDGADALLACRLRKVYGSNGEAVRQLNSRHTVANAIQFVANQTSSEAANYARILESFGWSDMPEEVLAAYIKAYMENPADIAFNLGTLGYDGDIDETGTWRISRDPDLYAQMIAAMESGEPLTDYVADPEVY